MQTAAMVQTVRLLVKEPQEEMVGEKEVNLLGLAV